jgi:hypothetical protein
MNEGLYPIGRQPAALAMRLRAFNQLSTGTGTYRPGRGTKWLKLTMIGGGAGGSSTSAASTPCVGGDAAIAVTYWLAVTKNAYSYSIGAGGLGVAAGAGQDGGNTTFDSFTAYGAKGPSANPATGFQPGKNSPYGQGGNSGGGAASGHGAGGGGTNGSSTTGGAGSEGLILVEEY